MVDLTIAPFAISLAQSYVVLSIVWDLGDFRSGRRRDLSARAIPNYAQSDFWEIRPSICDRNPNLYLCLCPRDILNIGV